jgi:hypothetical protein
LKALRLLRQDFLKSPDFPTALRMTRLSIEILRAFEGDLSVGWFDRPRQLQIRTALFLGKGNSLLQFQWLPSSVCQCCAKRPARSLVLSTATNKKTAFGRPFPKSLGKGTYAGVERHLVLPSIHDEAASVPHPQCRFRVNRATLTARRPLPVFL